MADELYSGEKSEAATPRKKQEAREKGQVPRSQDLNTALLLLAAFLLFFFLGGQILQQVIGLEVAIFDGLGTGRVTQDSAVAVAQQGMVILIWLMLPLAGGLLVVGLTTNLLQIGFLVTSKPLTPDLNRLNPLKGLGRIFSKRGLMRLLFGLLKLAIVGFVLVQGFKGLISLDSPENLFGLLNLSLWGVVEFSQKALFSLGAKASATLLALALLDVAFQRWQHEKDLMMTKQEVREELRRMEGDPKNKERRRAMQQRLALQRMMHDVPKADVVITNPTHVACAVQYEERSMRAPKLLAKGRGTMAHRIRETAIEHSVPVVEEPPLARIIYETTEVGGEIPPDLYKPVAEVLAYVYRLENKRSSSPSMAR